MRRTRFTLLAAILFAATLTLVYVGCQNDNAVMNSRTDGPTFGGHNAAAVAKAIAVQEANTEDLMKMKGVIGTGVGLGTNGELVVRVFTSSSESTGKIAKSIGGMPVEVEEIGEVRAFGYTGTYRPVPIGVSIGNVTPGTYCMAGTLGCVVIKNGEKYILSNNHVMARENEGAIGENIQQPGSLDTKPQCYIIPSKYVATLSDFVRITASGNKMDAAIAKYTTTDVTCAFANNTSNFPGTTPVNATVGMAIKKVGRTSGLTTGTVTTLNVTINVQYDFGIAQFTGQVATSRRFSKSGDSGSLIVTNNTAENPVGLLFAGATDGTTIFNPIAPVLQAFGVTICGQ